MSKGAITVGDRVGAILSWDDDGIKLLGYGVYNGDKFCTLLPTGWNMNPHITLDNGDIVWGCQCWWGSEDKVKAAIEQAKKDGQTITEVRIADCATPVS